MLSNINNFLQRFKNLKEPDIEIRNTTSLVLEEKTQTKIDIKNIFYNKKTGVLLIKTTPLNKNIIFLMKEKIISNINKTLSKESLIKNIILK